MKNKINKKLLYGFICSSFTLGAISLSISLPLSIKDNKSVIINKNKNEINESKEIIPSDYYYQTPLLTQETGPIISYNSTITSLDWFGAKRWQIDLTNEKYSQFIPGNNTKPIFGGWDGQYTQWTNRLFINWQLDIKTHTLWLITNAQRTSGGNVTQQNIIKINSLTGDVIKSYPLNNNVSNYDYSQYRLFYQISVLASGKILAYARGTDQWGANALLDPNDGTVKYNLHDDVKKISPTIDKTPIGRGKKRLLYLLPITTNVNIMCLSDFNESHKEGNGTGDLYLTLVDDNLKEITTSNQSSPWKNFIHIPNNTPRTETNWFDNATRFSKSFYKTIDNKTYFTAFGSFFVFDNKLTDNYGVKFSEYKLEQNQAISSFTMDVNENVFFKYIGDTNIKKLIINKKDDGTANFSRETYYDLNGSSVQEIRDNAKNYILFNVTNQTGSIMLINTRLIEKEQGFNPTTVDQDKTKQYGLAAGIVPNEKSNDGGDSKGLLNGEKSILKASDFEIKQEVLNSKLPSEITRNDITLLNGGFFTSNNTMDGNNLKYPPFTISDIKDTDGTFKISAYLDQIPWFSNKLPADSIPKLVEKVYDSNNKAQVITSKTSWKKQEELSYDFKNTLPTELTQEDIDSFDPFQVSFSSQTILDNGNTLYPKKTYIKETPNDNDGTVLIKIRYQYVPMGVSYKSASDVITYEANNTYTIFSNKNEKQFYFAGSNEKATETSKKPIDINTVPQLKALSQSNLLPSSFNGKNKNEFLQFVNTNKSAGYPISKMDFSVAPNDNTGSLTITANKKGTNEYFRQEFVGFNKTNEYSFSFKDTNSIGSVNFNTLLPSSINDGNVIDSLINYQGFNSSDFSINLYPNDANGSLKVEVVLNNSYAPSLGNGNGFNGYKTEKTYSGFMTTNEYNNKYNVSFKDDSDSSLIDIKKNTLDVIYNQIKDSNQISNSKKITIGDKNYNNLNDLIDKVFVDSKGTNIPQDWGSKTDKIKTNMAIDNQAGTMNLSITIDKSLLNGYDSDLNYVVSYSGFSKGNIKPTDDTLTFVDQNLLKAVLPKDQLNKTPSELAIWLKENDNIKTIIFNSSGQYTTFLNEKKYSLEIETSDAYKTITITLTFTEHLDDKDSLSTYSIQYKL